MTNKQPSLESLRAEEARLECVISHRKGMLAAGQQCHDLGSLAERLSDVKKQIASQALCHLFTA